MAFCAEKRLGEILMKNAQSVKPGIKRDELRLTGAEGAFRNSEKEAADVNLRAPRAAVVAFKAAFFDVPSVQAADLDLK